MTVLLPIPAFNYDEIIFSSFGLTATDSNADGILSVGESGGVTLYQGLAKGSSLLDLSGARPR